MTPSVYDLIKQIQDYIKHEGHVPKVIYVNNNFYMKLLSDINFNCHICIPFAGGALTFEGIELRRVDNTHPDFSVF